MPRLFSAIVPPADVVDHLAAELERVAGPAAELADVRWIPADRWHVTLGFFGDDDDTVRREKWLRRRATNLPAPQLRVVGAGTFAGLLWAGVETTDDVQLAKLARAAGAGRRGYQPHVTLARWRTGNPDRDALAGLFTGYCGPWFRPADLRLIRSDPGATGPTYSTVATLPLVHD